MDPVRTAIAAATLVGAAGAVVAVVLTSRAESRRRNRHDDEPPVRRTPSLFADPIALEQALRRHPQVARLLRHPDWGDIAEAAIRFFVYRIPCDSAMWSESPAWSQVRQIHEEIARPKGHPQHG